jgi:uncharacterized protein YyaL (SSP411 family)
MMTFLDKSISPSLLQHKDNPVAWRPWSDAVLAEAKAQNKPIFLSIGSTGCHWCHVMNQESFSDPEIAALINDNFIPVLVDREERRDVDQIYQAAAAVMGHAGGWPLNAFLMPDGVPFAVGGFMGREFLQPGQAGVTGERPGQPSFRQVLNDMIALYKERYVEAALNSTRVLEELNKIFERDMRGGLDSIQLEAAAIRIGQRHDIFMGGLMGATKFPSVPLLEVLWRAYLRTGLTQFLQILSPAMNSMLMGGLYDHVGGGFFRYTTDERWMVPHFEKTLVDNALLVGFMTQMWQFNRNELCRQRVSETIDWLMREMRLEGAFANGLTAYSDGEEGKYYIWTEAEIDAALAGTFSARFKQVYGVRRDGDFNGKTILRRFADATPSTGVDEVLMAKQRALLLQVRSKRTRPQRDDMLLADGNGLAIRALAFAGSAFDRAEWVAAAVEAFDAVVKLMDDDGVLYHAWAGGQRGPHGLADDYVHMAEAALQLYESTGDKRFVEAAKKWVRTLDTQFWDDARGGYYLTAHDAERVIIRTRMIFDQPAPSANGAMIAMLTKLALITGDSSYGHRAQAVVQAFAGEFTRNWISAGGYLNGFECFATGLQMVVAGKPDNAATKELVRAIWGKALPDRLLVMVESTEELPPGHPAHGKPLENGQPTVYLCQRNTCSQPITGAVALSQALTLPQQRGAAA